MTRALLLLLALASCAPTAPPSLCSLLRWIEVPERDIDRISDELAVQLRAHNETVIRECEP